MNRLIGVYLLGICACASLTPARAQSGDTEQDRVTESGVVLQDILEAPDKGIPQGLLEDAKCVITLPGTMKAAFGIGVSYGRGVMNCRTGENFTGAWSDPIMMASESGSIGFQIGAQGTDYVILVMNDAGARSLMRSKLKLGADASIAAGPVGRTAEAATTGTMNAQMLSYSRSHGVFAGVSLSGASLRIDGDANKNLYGKEVSAKQIMQGAVATPPEAKSLLATLTRDCQKKPSPPPR